MRYPARFVATMFLPAFLSAGAGAQQVHGDSAQLAQGKQIVSTVCAACHTEQPPAKLAPPFAHVAARYRMKLGDRDKTIERMVAWIKTPAKDRSLLPPMAIERFGLMPPLPLPDAQLQAAAAYLWSLSDESGTMNHDVPPGAAHGAKHGMKPGMKHGMKPAQPRP